jgi:hypothetical protein
MLSLAPVFPLLASTIPAFIGAVTPPSRADRISRFGYSYMLSMSVVALLQSSINHPHLSFHVVVSEKVAIPYLLFIIFHFTISLILFSLYNFSLRIPNVLLRTCFALLAFSSALLCALHAVFIPQAYALKAL